MQLVRIAAIAAAGAALLYSLNSQSLAFVVLGKGADDCGSGGTGFTLTHRLEPRVSSIEARLKAMERDTKRSQRELRSARAALIVARFEMLGEDSPIIDDLSETQAPE